MAGRLDERSYYLYNVLSGEGGRGATGDEGEDADGNKLQADAWAAEDDDDDEAAIEMAPKASRFSPSFQDPAETHLYKDPPSPTTPTFGSQVDYTPMYEPLQERAHEELEELMLRDGGGGEGSRRGMVSRLIAGARARRRMRRIRGTR